MLKFFIYSGLFLLFQSCLIKEEPIKIAYQETALQEIKSNPEHTYFISKPTDFHKGLPLIIGIDAKADGKSSAERIITAVNFTKAVVVTSNLIKNGTADFNQLINEIVTECVRLYEIDSKNIILTGFSGGARMVLLYSNNFPVSGLIMMGAGPGMNHPKTRTYTICGLSDFNLVETYERPEINQLDDANFIVDHFQGDHRWSDTVILRDACLFHFKNYGQGLSERIDRVEGLIDLSEEYLIQDKALLSWKCLEKAYKLTDDVAIKNKIRANAKDLLENEAYRKGISSFENFLRMELGLRKQYMEKAGTASFQEWKDEISTLELLSKSETDIRQAEQASRLKGYLGILFYSRLKLLLFTDGNEKQTEVLLKAFGLLEPKNPDMMYFKALQFTKNGAMDSASHYLALSRKYGLEG